MKVDDFFRQKRTDLTMYGLAVQELKNGSFKAITVEGKKVKFTSTNGMYPVPEIVTIHHIPDDVLNMMMKKSKELK